MTHAPASAARAAYRPARPLPPRKRRGSLRATMSLNLTPMIDVVFNLLIFFVVGTRFAEVEGLLRSKLPAAPSESVQPAVPLMPIRVRLAKDPAQPEGCLIRI